MTEPGVWTFCSLDFVANFVANWFRLEQCVVAAPEPEWRKFSPLKLQVYGNALASVTVLTERSLLWDKRHAVVESNCNEAPSSEGSL